MFGKKKAALAEWVVSELGFCETATATWITEDNEMIRVSQMFSFGDVHTSREAVKAKRDAAIVRIIEEGPEKGTELGKPRWYRE